MIFIIHKTQKYELGYCVISCPRKSCDSVCVNNCGRVCAIDCASNNPTN